MSSVEEALKEDSIKELIGRNLSAGIREIKNAAMALTVRQRYVTDCRDVLGEKFEGEFRKHMEMGLILEGAVRTLRSLQSKATELLEF